MTTPNSSDVAVIIVNFNTADLAIEAVKSVLKRDHHGRSVQVHLVDNASPNGDGAALAEAIASLDWADQVILYRETENHGFGRGNNLVLATLVASPNPPHYVFLLNPDARLENEAIGILADFLDTRPGAAVAGAKIEKPGGIPVAAAFRFMGMASTFSSALSFGPVTRMLARWQVPLPAHLPTCRVDWVSGAAVMLRLSAMCEVGFFDPEFFLYFEEVDLMRRMCNRGWEVWHVAESHIEHEEGAATDVRSGRVERRRLPAYWYHSWQHYFLRNHGRAGAIFAATVWWTGSTGNWLLGLVPGRKISVPRKFYRDSWAVAVRPLLGLKALPYD